MATDAPRVLHLSLVVPGELRDAAGERLGRVDDLIVRLGQEDYPPITGLLATVAGRQAFVPADRVAELGPGHATLNASQLDLQRFERRPDEVLLRRDVLDRQLINVDGARLVRANDIALARSDGWWRVVGVDTGVRGAARRLLPRRLAGRVGAREFLDWASLEPFVGHVPTVRMRVAHPKLARLHPAQLADLVEAASHDQGDEIIRAVESEDRDREADVFEELDARHQAEFFEERSDAELAEILSRMAPDDAADVIAALAPERRDAVLALLPPQNRRRIGALLGYDAATAGGLMSPDFVVLDRHASVGEARERVARTTFPPETLTDVLVVNSHRRLEGRVPLAELLRHGADEPLLSALEGVPALRPEASFEEVARTMADYNLTTAPVVDGEERLLGVVTVDDVLDGLLPAGWRRRFGLLGED